MPRDTPKPWNSMFRKPGKARRSVVRLQGRSWRSRAWSLVQSPPFGYGVAIALIFVVLASAMSAWSRRQPLVAVGRVMNETRTVRLAMNVVDTGETENQRELARQRTPRVYVADVGRLSAIETSLVNLPLSLSGVERLDDVDPSIRAAFRLTEPSLRAVQDQLIDGEVSEAWASKVSALMGVLQRRPVLDEQAWQRATQEGSHNQIELRLGDDEPVFERRGTQINVSNAEQLEDAARGMARRAGFAGELLVVVANRLVVDATPTFRFDPAATTEAQDAAADQVPPQIREIPPGTTIFTRGEELTPTQLDLYRAELGAFYDRSQPWVHAIKLASVVGVVAAVTLALAGYTSLFCPRIRRNPTRMAALATLMLVTLAMAVFGAAAAPGMTVLAAVTPTVFFTALIAIAYDQRVALAMGALHALLVCAALDLSVGMYALLILGIGVCVWQLGEIRDRRRLVKMAAALSVALALGMGVVGVLERPALANALLETLADAGIAACAGLMVGAVTLFLLPLIERGFDITTGMTLIELRDPKQPLLRELQLRAPGTYNHSLNVASIAESAADAIGADPLLTYVGSLYHDIGKMNKPEYFIENQSGGPNRHEKLSPAMSLLVIVGHVKDGMEMAREYALPRTLTHFIDAHHGTTLVEFFYHRARQQAQENAGGEDLPEEIEYRYPGPKPRTKECAILMLADSVESATRAMAEPTPSRIDALVRELANKKLMDGQFDECDLTLRELHTIVESISKSVASIYHSRVAYPDGKSSKADAKPSRTTRATGTAGA